MWSVSGQEHFQIFGTLALTIYNSAETIYNLLVILNKIKAPKNLAVISIGTSAISGLWPNSSEIVYT